MKEKIQPFQIGDWTIRPELDCISRGRDEVAIQPRLMDVLVYLARNRGSVVSADDLIEKVWKGVIVSEDSVYHSISKLREALGDDTRQPRYIQTVPKRGYRLVAVVEGNVTGSGRRATDSQNQTFSRSRMALALAAAILLVMVVSFWPGEPGQTPTPARSIAVMPFADLSPDKNQQYFVDGIAEELLNELANLPGLKVISRTSSFSANIQALSAREIGQVLGVATIVEGSVRKDGGRVRITAQLINTADGSHLWSDIFEHDLESIFNIQGEISRSISAALQIKLEEPGKDARAVPILANPEAYDLYLMGAHFLELRGQTGGEEIEKALDYFERSVKLDSDYAPAWIGLAEARFISPLLTGVGMDKRGPPTLVAIEKAMALDDGYAEAYAALGMYLHFENKDLEAADRAYLKALALNPNLVKAYVWRNQILLRQWRLAEADEQAQLAYDLDPLSRIAIGALGTVAELRGDVDQSIGLLRKQISLGFNIGGLMTVNIARVLLRFGRIAEAVDWLEANQEAMHTPAVRAAARYLLVSAYLSLDDFESAERWADPELIDLIHLARGEYQDAARVARSRLERQQGLPEAVRLAAAYEMRAGNYASAQALLLEAKGSEDNNSSRYIPGNWSHMAIPETTLAFLRFRSGDAAGGDELLLKSERIVERVLDGGGNFPDLYVEAARQRMLRNDDDGALESLRLAFEKGWRAAWLIEGDPILSSLQDHPDFPALMAEVQSELAKQRAILEQDPVE